MPVATDPDHGACSHTRGLLCRDACLNDVTFRQAHVKNINIVLEICQTKECPPHFPPAWPLGLGGTKEGKEYWRGTAVDTRQPRCQSYVKSTFRGAGADKFEGARETACDQLSVHYWVRARGVTDVQFFQCIFRVVYMTNTRGATQHQACVRRFHAPPAVHSDLLLCTAAGVGALTGAERDVLL